MFTRPFFEPDRAASLAFAAGRGFGTVCACDGGKPVASALPFWEMPGVRLLFMQSSGGLTRAGHFQGKDAILSGPALFRVGTRPPATRRFSRPGRDPPGGVAPRAAAMLTTKSLCWNRDGGR